MGAHVGGGGGAAAPITREEWNGGADDVPENGGGSWASWLTSGGPDSLIDATDPIHPTIITAGVYMVSVAIGPGTMVDTGYFNAGLHLDRDGFNASMYAQSSQAHLPVAGRVSDVTLSLAWYIPAGNQIGVFVENQSAFVADFIMGYAHIQRLS